MSHQDREIFEAWASAHDIDDDGFIEAMKKSVAEKAWQAACDHYAPKLTEKEAVKAAADAMVKRGFYGSSASAYDCAIEALRATGVRFKEEA